MEGVPESKNRSHSLKLQIVNILNIREPNNLNRVIFRADFMQLCIFLIMCLLLIMVFFNRICPYLL